MTYTKITIIKLKHTDDTEWFKIITNLDNNDLVLDVIKPNELIPHLQRYIPHMTPVPNDIPR